jgi:hypothetical protein
MRPCGPLLFVVDGKHFASLSVGSIIAVPECENNLDFFSVVTPLMTATVAVPVIAFRDAARFAVVMNIDDLFRVATFRTLVLSESVGETADLTK